MRSAVGTDGPAPPRPLVRFAGRSVLGFIGLGLGALLLAGLLYAASDFVITVDRSVVAALNRAVAPHPAVVTALHTVSLLGASVTCWIVLSTLALYVAVRRQLRLAAFIVVTGIGATALGPAVKQLVGRVRPVVDAPVAAVPGPGFPSGHTLGVTVMIGVLLLVLLPAARPGVRRPLIGIGVALVVLVGFSRIALGVHFPSDVVAGAAIGLGWLAVTTSALHSWRRHEGLAVPPIERGLEPEAVPVLSPAPGREPPAAPPVTVLARLLVTAVLLLAAVLGFGLLLTHVLQDSALERADAAAVRWVVERRTPVLDELSGPAAELGNTGVVFGGGLVAAVLAVAVWRCWRPALVLAVALLGELAIFLSSAVVVARPRPRAPHLDPALPPTSSFPSGHTGAAICLYGTIAALVMVAVRAWWRWLVLALAVAVVVTVALARLYRGAHFPTDLAGSVLFAVPWLIATLRLLPPSTGGPINVSARRRPSGTASRAPQA
ncbi:MAG TPA: phosphatase PAP2 family protein [Pseudonocardia sp.]|nr:phosphatase PAP2 family protein [Pseudonocardia sp.]